MDLGRQEHAARVGREPREVAEAVDGHREDAGPVGGHERARLEVGAQGQQPSSVARRSGGNCQREGGGSTGIPRTLCQHPAHERPTAHAELPVWGDPRAWSNPPALAGEVAADLCVVGLGGSGLAAVGAATAAGASVVGLDAGPSAAARPAATAASCWPAAPCSTTPRRPPWGARARGRHLHRHARRDGPAGGELGGAIVRRVGSLRIPASPAEAEDCGAARRLLRDGFRAERAPGPTGDGVLIPDDGSLDPLARCRLLAAAASRTPARGSSAAHRRSRSRGD